MLQKQNKKNLLFPLKTTLTLFLEHSSEATGNSSYINKSLVVTYAISPKTSPPSVVVSLNSLFNSTLLCLFCYV